MVLVVEVVLEEDKTAVALAVVIVVGYLSDFIFFQLSFVNRINQTQLFSSFYSISKA